MAAECSLEENAASAAQCAVMGGCTIVVLCCVVRVLLLQSGTTQSFEQGDGSLLLPLLMIALLPLVGIMQCRAHVRHTRTVDMMQLFASGAALYYMVPWTQNVVQHIEDEAARPKAAKARTADPLLDFVLSLLGVIVALSLMVSACFTLYHAAVEKHALVVNSKHFLRTVQAGQSAHDHIMKTINSIHT